MKKSKKVVETTMSDKELKEWGDNFIKDTHETGDGLSEMGKAIMKFTKLKIPGATHIIISEDYVEVLESDFGVNFILGEE